MERRHDSGKVLVTSSERAALCGAVLPFLLPWKQLDPSLKVADLGKTGTDWKMLLGGQGVEVSADVTGVPDGAAVVTGFSHLDTVPLQDLPLWLERARSAMRPGGVLILGGSNPEHPEVSQELPLPGQMVRVFRDAGFARVREIFPSPIAESGSPSLEAVFYGISPVYAVVAQAPARGGRFDLFSPAFAADPGPDRRELLQRYQAWLERALWERAHEDANLRAEIEALRAELARATRRRGLRKFVYKLKQRRLARRAMSQERPAQSAPAPEREVAVAPVDPVPLSPRELALRDRLAGSGSA